MTVCVAAGVAVNGVAVLFVCGCNYSSPAAHLSLLSCICACSCSDAADPSLQGLIHDPSHAFTITEEPQPPQPPSTSSSPSPPQRGARQRPGPGPWWAPHSQQQWRGRRFEPFGGRFSPWRRGFGNRDGFRACAAAAGRCNCDDSGDCRCWQQQQQQWPGSKYGRCSNWDGSCGPGDRNWCKQQQQQQNCGGGSASDTASSAAPPAPTPAPAAVVHAGVACDCCGVKPIVGVRYKCVICANYDLCEGCKDKNEGELLCACPMLVNPVVVAAASGDADDATCVETLSPRQPSS